MACQTKDTKLENVMILLVFFSMYQVPSDYGMYKLLFNKFLDIKDRMYPDDASVKFLSRVLNNFLLKMNDEVLSDEEDDGESED